jgi:hypothetical protein
VEGPLGLPLFTTRAHPLSKQHGTVLEQAPLEVTVTTTSSTSTTPCAVQTETHATARTHYALGRGLQLAAPRPPLHSTHPVGGGEESITALGNVVHTLHELRQKRTRGDN